MSKLILWALCIGIMVVACYDKDDYVIGAGLAATDVIALSPSSAQVPADGTSFVTLKAQIDVRADADKRSVRFTTTKGQFQGTTSGDRTVLADANGVASIILVSPTQEGWGLVQASIAGVVQEAQIEFTHAYPESVVVDPGTFALHASVSENTTVTASLLRKVGVVASGTLVSFSASDTTGSRVGQFRDTKQSDANGRATALFTVGSTSYRGAVTIRAESNAAGVLVAGESSVVIID